MKRLLLVAIAILTLAVTASAQTSHGVDLTWTASTDAAANPSLTYNEYRLIGACPTTGTPVFTKVNSAPITTTEFFDANPAPINSTLCYYVTAVLNGLESAPSSTVQLVFLPPPFPPTGLKAIER